MVFKQANGANFARGRTQPIEFLVIHYTANNGDTVQNNLDYFSCNAAGASAHYFVPQRQQHWYGTVLQKGQPR